MTPRHEMWLGCVVENHIKYIKIIIALHGYLIYVCIWKCGSCTYVASSTFLRVGHRWDQSGLNFGEIEDSELLLLWKAVVVVTCTKKMASIENHMVVKVHTTFGHALISIVSEFRLLLQGPRLVMLRHRHSFFNFKTCS